MSVRTYDPAQFLFSFAGVPLTAYAPDTFIKVERDEDSFSKQTGATGEVTRSKSNNRGGKVTLTLMSHSQDNDALSAIQAADELSGTGVAPLQGKELNGTTVVSAANAWIQKPPAVERGKESGTTEWTFDCAVIEVFNGGLL